MPKSKLKPLTESPRYESFIASRDQTLEEILQKYLRALGAPVTWLQHRVHEVVSHVGIHDTDHANLKRRRQELEKRLHPWFEMAVEQSVYLIKNLRRTSYVLSYAGQAEGIGRALGTETKRDLSKSDIHVQIDAKAVFGGDLKMRVELSYSRLMRDVLDAFQLSQVMGSTPTETLERIDRAFPKKIKDTKPSRKLAPMKEAGFLSDSNYPTNSTQDDVSISTGVIPQEDWDASLNDYFAEYFPAETYHRSPFGHLFTTDEGDRYEWQIEQDTTEDFVQQVRDGENDAANANGINDFQWISIVDSKTDDCCLWRDGLTTTEIEKELAGDHSDDDCDAVTVPAHPFCRCRMAPMTADMPEESPPDFGGFSNWLDQQKADAA